MKCEVVAFTDGGKRDNPHNWAIEIIPETDFEKSFFGEMFRSCRSKHTSMQPTGRLIFSQQNVLCILIESEDYNAKLKRELKDERDD